MYEKSFVGIAGAVGSAAGEADMCLCAGDGVFNGDAWFEPRAASPPSLRTDLAAAILLACSVSFLAVKVAASSNVSV
jgi:hypothetical protein